MLAVLATLGLVVCCRRARCARRRPRRSDRASGRSHGADARNGPDRHPLFVPSNAGVSMHVGAPPVLIVLLVAGIIVLARPGVTGIWGKSVVLDPRFLTSYVRDVSLVSNAEYDRLAAPSMIQSVPADLANPNLEYSGIFEDGWVGRESYAQLSGGPSGRLMIRADVLARRRGQRLQVLVNGKTLVSRRVAPGSPALDLPLRPPRAGGRSSFAGPE